MESSRALPVWLLLLGSLGAIMGFCTMERDYVAATALAAMTVSALWGYYVGAMRLLGYFSSLAAAYACAFPVSPLIEPHIVQQLSMSSPLARLLGLAIGSAASFLATLVIAAGISRRLLEDRPHLDVANRLLGFGVGGLQGAAAMLVLLSGIQVTEPHATRRMSTSNQVHKKNELSRAVAQRVVNIANATRASSVGPIVTAYNPFEKLPRLKNLQRTAFVVADPNKLNEVMRSPALDRLKSNPDVRGAIESLARDPQLRKLAESGQLLDQSTAMTLLNHPSVAKLLEQEDLMKHFTEAMSELDSPVFAPRPDVRR